MVNIKLHIILLFFVAFAMNIFAAPQPPDTLETLDLDSILSIFENDTVLIKNDSILMKNDSLFTKNDSIITLPAFEALAQKMLNDSTPQHFTAQWQPKILMHEDSLLYFGNPFFVDLIYMGKSVALDIKKPKQAFEKPFFEKEATFNDTQGTAILNQIRQNARNEITKTRTELYVTNIWDLPNSEINKSRYIPSKHIDHVPFSMSVQPDKKLDVKKPKYNPWTKKADVMVHVMQNHVSKNWHQGGTDSWTILNQMSGSLHYDNRKDVKWENFAEWKMGFIHLDDTVSRPINISDDNFKIDSKFYIKAIGHWSYTQTLNFWTQIFENYKSYNKPKPNEKEQIKSKFFSPVYLNYSIGMTYDYKKISITFDPVSYQVKYLTDTAKLNPNDFGIKTNERTWSDVGSKIEINLKEWSPLPDLRLKGKLWVWTNFDRVKYKIGEKESDEIRIDSWLEFEANYTLNRYLSVRVYLNPRYYSTHKTKNAEGVEEKAKIQFKEMFSFGFNFKFR